MSEPFLLDSTPFASLANLESTLSQIIEIYKSYPSLGFSDQMIDNFEKNTIRNISDKAKTLRIAADQMRLSLKPLILSMAANSCSPTDAQEVTKSAWKTLAALDEMLGFIIEISSSQVAEARFLRWLNLSKVPFLPIRQDYFSFYGKLASGLKRPDFIIYNNHKIIDDAVINGEVSIARISECASVDIKAFPLQRDQIGSYFILPKKSDLTRQIGLDGKVGALSYWCIIPPEEENLGIIIDINHLLVHRNRYAAGDRVYYKDIISMPINLYTLSGEQEVSDRVELIFLFSQLASNHEYDVDFVAQVKRRIVDYWSLRSRSWNFWGVSLNLPYPGVDGYFVYEDHITGREIILTDEREAALIEFFLGAVDTSYPIDKPFFERSISAFPNIYRFVTHWTRYINFVKQA